MGNYGYHNFCVWFKILNPKELVGFQFPLVADIFAPYPTPTNVIITVMFEPVSAGYIHFLALNPTTTVNIQH